MNDDRTCSGTAGPVWFSDQRDEPVAWHRSQDALMLMLIPRRWWSLHAWRLAMGVRPHVRWDVATPHPRQLDMELDKRGNDA